MPGFGRCPSPCRGERRRHLVLAEPVRSAMLPGSGPARDCGSAIVRRWPRATSAPIRAALLVSENRQGSAFSICLTSWNRTKTASGAPMLNCARVGAVGGGPTAEAAVADRRNALEALLAEAGRIPHDRALSGLIGGAGHPQRDFPHPMGRPQRPAPPRRRQALGSGAATAQPPCQRLASVVAAGQRRLDEPGDDIAARQVWTELA